MKKVIRIKYVSILRRTFTVPREEAVRFVIDHFFEDIEKLIDYVIELPGEGYETAYLESTTKVASSWKNRFTQKDRSQFKNFHIKEKNIHTINMAAVDDEMEKRIKEGKEKPEFLIKSRMELITFEIPKNPGNKYKKRMRYIKVPVSLKTLFKETLRKKGLTIIEDQ
jgi:hypothetical protein